MDALLGAVVAQSGTDLHLAIGYPPLMRRGGELEALREAALSSTEVEALLFEIMTPPERSRVAEEKELDSVYACADNARFRVNYFYALTGLSAVFRSVPSRILRLDELGCPDVIRRVCEQDTGLALVTGPARSGKTTTLAAMIDHVNETRACNILTIERPGGVHPRVEVGPGDPP